MLVLSRNKGESIMIDLSGLTAEQLEQMQKANGGKDAVIVVTIVDVRGGKVRLGTTAPKVIPVHRNEVYESIQREKREKRKSASEQIG